MMTTSQGQHRDLFASLTEKGVKYFAVYEKRVTVEEEELASLEEM